MDGRPIRDGLAGFIADLADFGVGARADGPAVIYEVVPASGPRRGQAVSTGVGAAELVSWPAAPPHWIHLPVDVQFAHTNANHEDVLPAWRRHSRQIGSWGPDEHPGRSWLAHVRRVLADIAA